MNHKEEEKLEKAAKKYGGHIYSIMLFAIDKTKTGAPRTIPLNSKAIEILKNETRNICGFVWNIMPDSITQAFERICENAKISDLRFHYLRHKAASRFFEKSLNIMEVSSITGHKDLKMLKWYTHLKTEDLAQKLQ